MVISALFSLICSTVLYLYLHKKTHMNRFIFLKDNLIAALLGFLAAWAVFALTDSKLISWAVIPVVIVPAAYAMIQIRFWRTPKRAIKSGQQDILSPADGNVIYINHVTDPGQIVSIKNGRLSDLTEISQTDLISLPCWHIGINMTPFDVHKNCSPISGKLLLSKHITGSFHSLKEFLSMTENERHTYVIESDKGRIGVVQIASRRVRRIDTYVQEGSDLKVGDWIGMIRFGSQVDVFLPENSNPEVRIKQQVYARKTILARWK